MAFRLDGQTRLMVFDAAAQQYEGLVKIKKIAWASGAGTGSTLKLTTLGGFELANLTSVAAQEYIKIDHLVGAWVKGLVVDTMSAGELYVLYE